MADTSTYWAAEPDSSELVSRCLERVQRHVKRLSAQGRLSKAMRTLSARYGRGVDGAVGTDRMRSTGAAGGTTALTVNLIRPGLEHVLGLVTGQRPGLKPVPLNTDSTSSAQARLADELRGYYERKLDCAGLEIDVVRGGIAASSWWLVQSWRPTLGAKMAVDPDTNRVIYESDVELLSLPFWRCAADTVARRQDQRTWVAFRTPGNRFDLAAAYPHCADKLTQGAAEKLAADWGQTIGVGPSEGTAGGLDALLEDVVETEDAVWVWELRHLPTPALPEGRLVRFVNDDCVLYDSAAVRMGEGEETQATAYPYSELHAYEWAPERVVGTANGHTAAFDMLAVQQFADVCTTSIATTVNVLGLPHLYMGPGGEGAAANTYELGRSGIMAIEGSTPPQVVDFQALKPEVVSALGLARDIGRETLSLNNVVVGQPDKGMPAQAMALMRAQAVQFHQAAQGEYMRLVEQNMTGILALLKRFATSARVSQVAGLSGEWLTREWQAKDIANMSRYVVERIDATTLSYESRVALAETMAKMGWLDRESFLSIYRSGDLKERLDSATSARDLIAANKDLLRQGIGLPPIDMAATDAAVNEALEAGVDPTQVGPVFTDDGERHVRLLKTDPHWTAYNEYKAVLDSPASRENPAVVAAVSGVLQETLRLWASMTPDEIAAAQGQALPSQMAMAAPPPPGDDAEGTPGELAGPATDAPKLPKPPQDPLTGAREGSESLGGLSV